jgi:L-lactate dehydrogenase complex protein LldG
VAILQSEHIVPDMSEACDVLGEVFASGNVTFITGPSRTADIERVLTIGVHGPSRLIVMAVDEDLDGGAS